MSGAGRRVRWRLVAAAVAVAGVSLGLGLCAAVVAVGMTLSAPHPSAIGPPPPDLAGAEGVEIPSASGSVLRGWWVPGMGPGGGAVVLLHGVWENRLRMVARARKLAAHGFSVLLIDLQAHGESPGRRITFGHLEGLDAAAAVDYVRDRRPDDRVGVIGVSLGGAAALLGPARLAVDGLVLESVYPDIDAALSSRLRSGLGPTVGAVFTPVLTPLFEMLLPPILGVGPGELRPVDRIGEVRAPVLILSGSVDDRTPIEEAQALFARAAGPKSFWAVEGAGHVDLEGFGPEVYWQHVLPFLARTLRDAGAS